jgi:hypothetical protein
VESTAPRAALEHNAQHQPPPSALNVQFALEVEDRQTAMPYREPSRLRAYGSATLMYV